MAAQTIVLCVFTGYCNTVLAPADCCAPNVAIGSWYGNPHSKHGAQDEHTRRDAHDKAYARPVLMAHMEIANSELEYSSLLGLHLSPAYWLRGLADAWSPGATRSVLVARRLTPQRSSSSVLP